MKRVLAIAVALGSAGVAHADGIRDEGLPPWTDPGDVPLPLWARSVTPNRAEAAIYAEPGKLDQRRGSAQPGVRLPLFATRRASGCQGRWIAVGPLAWMCSDVADFTADNPSAPSLGARPGARPLPPIDPAAAGDDGLPYRYFFAGRDGAFGFVNLASALDDAPDQELEPGFAVAILEEASAHGERWGKTKNGRWVAMHELSPARPLVFHGELVQDGKLDFAWVVPDKASTYASDKADRPTGTRVRFEKVRIAEDKGAVVKLAEGGYMKSKDLARPRFDAPPPEAGGDTSVERWIDVDVAQQTLVAYEGTRPVFATLVSTGKGPAGSDLETKKGVHRIWVKIFTSKMDNLDNDDVERHYAIEDVPYVQFFDNAIALHGAFWHREFGRAHSHGCVNLTPLDARWLFAFTAPHLPVGWTAVLPTKVEPGTLVRVR